ncbi:hypothetical protein Bca4012_010522 [Brassica carinata]
MDGRHGEREDAGIEDDDWHEFAMAETPMTTHDTKCYAGAKDLRLLDAIPAEMSGIAYTKRYAIPFPIRGVEIRDSEQKFRQRIQPEPDAAMQKGKKKMRIETTSDTDSDSDNDMVVPVFRTTADLSRKGKRPMWEHLIFGIAGIPNRSEEDNDNRRTTLASQSNPAPEGLDIVNDPHLPDLVDREEPPQRTVHQILGGEFEISDVHIEGGDLFGGGGLNSNINFDTSAAMTPLVKNSETASSIRRCMGGTKQELAVNTKPKFGKY